MAKKTKPEAEEQPELEGEVEPLDLTPPAKTEEVKAPEEKGVDPSVPVGAVAYFEEPEEFKHSFDLGFILDVLQSEYDPKAKAVVTRPSGATLLENTYKPILSSEGIGGIRRESVFSFQGSYYKIAASCSADQDQRFIHWDYPAVRNDNKVVMAQKVDPVQKTMTAYVPSTT